MSAARAQPAGARARRHRLLIGRRRWTIPTKLILTMACLASVVIVGSGVASTLAVRHYLTGRVSDRLQTSTQRISAGLSGLHGVTMTTDTVRGMARAESSAVVLETRDGSTVPVNTDADTARLIESTSFGDGKAHAVRGRDGLIAIRLDTAGQRLVVQDGDRALDVRGVVVAVDARNDLAAVQALVLANTAGALIAIGSLVVITVVVVRRGLRPLAVMSAHAQAFADGDRAVRLPSTYDDPDIARLAESVNEAFDAQQQAEARLRAFVADASHELRSPLTVVTGWVELYLQGGLSRTEDLDYALQRSESQLGRMRTLIDELALLARLDRTPTLATDPLDLAALAEDVVADLRTMNPDRDFTVDAGPPAFVLGDAAKLQQVLVNLLGNAVQHTPPGTAVGVSVIPAGPGPSAGARVHRVRVSDHGPGIPAADQPHIFERFWRGDSSRDRHTGGAGLGLSIVASIVAAHGGTSEVRSAPGEGATVEITLPAAPVGTTTRTPSVAAPVAVPSLLG